jgi:hypothetical protein
MFPRFLFFKKLSTFTEWSSNPSNAQYEGDLYFIQDESCIYTHGHKFKCSIDTSDVNSLLEEYCKVENPLSETDVITEESFTDNITYQ